MSSVSSSLSATVLQYFSWFRNFQGLSELHLGWFGSYILKTLHDFQELMGIWNCFSGHSGEHLFRPHTAS